MSGFPWRPAVSALASAAHQHCPFTFAQAVGKAERFDSLFVVDDRERARPVGAPQAAVETPGVEYAGKGVPDVRVGVTLLRQGACPADLDHRVRAAGQVEHLWQVGPGLRRGGRRTGLHDA